MAWVERCSMKTFLECTPSGMHAGMFSNPLSDIEIQGLVFRMSLQDPSIPRSFWFLSLLKATTDHHYHKLKLLSKSYHKSCRNHRIGCNFWQLLWWLQLKGTKGLSNDQWQKDFFSLLFHFFCSIFIYRAPAFRTDMQRFWHLVWANLTSYKFFLFLFLIPLHILQIYCMFINKVLQGCIFDIVKERILYPRSHVLKIGHGMGWIWKYLKWVGL